MENNIISLGFITVGQWLWKMLICFIYFIVTLYPIGLFYEAHFFGHCPDVNPQTESCNYIYCCLLFFLN